MCILSGATTSGGTSFSPIEDHLEVQLPSEFVSFLKIHNGQNSNSEGLLDAEQLLSTERIAQEWAVWKELLDKGTFIGIYSDPAGGVKNDWWNPKWIPITYDGSGNHYCIDLDPASTGTSGQIIRMWHDEGTRELVAPSFKVWISQYLAELKNGQYIYSEEYGGIIDKEYIR